MRYLEEGATGRTRGGGHFSQAKPTSFFQAPDSIFSILSTQLNNSASTYELAYQICPSSARLMILKSGTDVASDPMVYPIILLIGRTAVVATGNHIPCR